MQSDRAQRTFSYDAAGRLVTANSEWSSGQFWYDGLGNLREKRLGNRYVQIAYNAQNQIATVTDTDNPTRVFTHDARGNVTDDGRYEFDYDASNQPVTIDIGSTVLPNEYDGNFKRVKNMFTSNGTNSTVYTAYSKVSGTPIYRYYSHNQMQFEYPESIGPMSVWFLNGGFHSYRHLDPLGSVRSTTKVSGDAVIWFEEYTPFGERLIESSNHNNPGFTGHVRDINTGLNYMQARYYDPVIGRFYSTDPIGYRDQMNLYAYVGNDPVNNVDPDGRETTSITLDADLVYGAGGSTSVGGYVEYEWAMPTWSSILDAGADNPGNPIGMILDAVTNVSEVGTIQSYSMTAGMDVSAGVEMTYSGKSDASELDGQSAVAEGGSNVGPVSLSAGASVFYGDGGEPIPNNLDPDTITVELSLSPSTLPAPSGQVGKEWTTTERV